MGARGEVSAGAPACLVVLCAVVSVGVRSLKPAKRHNLTPTSFSTIRATGALSYQFQTTQLFCSLFNLLAERLQNSPSGAFFAFVLRLKNDREGRPPGKV